jgi:DHA1 family tetracycline resistance protein-like MFS transporter
MVVLQRLYALRGIRNPALRVLLMSDALILIAVAMVTPIYAVFVSNVGGDILDAGLTAAGLGFLLFTTVNNVWYLAGIQVAIGLVRALADPAFDALYSTHLDRNQEAAEWGTWEALAYAAGGVGAIMGGIIVHFSSFDALFVVMAALCFISSLYVMRIPKRVL